METTHQIGYGGSEGFRRSVGHSSGKYVELFLDSLKNLLSHFWVDHVTGIFESDPNSTQEQDGVLGSEPL